MIFKYITQSRRKTFFRSMVNILIFTFTFTTVGCLTTYEDKVKPEEVKFHQDCQIIKAVMKNGLVVDLRDKSARYAREYQNQSNVLLYFTVDTTRVGPNAFTKAYKTHILELKDILSLTIQKQEVDAGLTVLATLGIIAAVVAIIAVIAMATKESCPFIYSFDGQKYVFDAEPYGGAITEGLTRTDFSKLEHLKPVNGKYSLLMRNEADETQHTDAMKLYVIDHPINTNVTPDLYGNMVVYDSIIGPVNVIDENGRDIRSFFLSRDDVQWQSLMPSTTSLDGQTLRNELTFKFPKPKDAQKVRLLVNAGTALWGGHMIKKMLDLRGNKVDSWYEEINRKGPAFNVLYSFMEREELYSLKMNLKIDDQWQSRGFITAGGPFIIEDKIIELDISDIPGDTLYLRLNPPVGYWNIDYVGAIYDEPGKCSIKEIEVSKATDEKENDITSILTNADRKYYDMPDTTSTANIYFEAPAQVEGYQRTIFLKTTGYYDIHLKKDHPEQTDMLVKMWLNPGYIIQYSLEQYVEKMKALGTITH